MFIVADPILDVLLLEMEILFSAASSMFWILWGEGLVATCFTFIVGEFAFFLMCVSLICMF